MTLNFFAACGTKYYHRTLFCFFLLATEGLDFLVKHLPHLHLHRSDGFRSALGFDNIVKAEVLVDKVVSGLPFWNNFVVQAQWTWPRLLENPDFEAPHMLELLVKADWSSEKIVDIFVFLEHNYCLVFTAEYSSVHP